MFQKEEQHTESSKVGHNKPGVVKELQVIQPSWNVECKAGCWKRRNWKYNKQGPDNGRSYKPPEESVRDAEANGENKEMMLPSFTLERWRRGDE